jgi:hypothetical protein
LVGLPDTSRLRDSGRTILAGLSPERPTIVLTHDPYWFAYVPKGPRITIAGHTHGGQIRFPGIGALRNASRAPLRWSYGLVKEDGRYLYVTGGIGTSGIPLRIGAPPEYAVMEIHGAQGCGVADPCASGSCLSTALSRGRAENQLDRRGVGTFGAPMASSGFSKMLAPGDLMEIFPHRRGVPTDKVLAG